jgi:hypothetical protein
MSFRTRYRPRRGDLDPDELIWIRTGADAKWIRMSRPSVEGPLEP